MVFFIVASVLGLPAVWLAWRISRDRALVPSDGSMAGQAKG